MKAKNILLYSAMASMALSLSSCGDDFLSVEPASSLPIDGYYNTKSHLDEAVTAAYAPLAWYDYYDGWCPLFLVSDAQGDDIYVGGGSTSDQQEIHLASQYKSTSLMTFKGAWTTSYSGINRSNWLIKDAEEAAGISDAERAAYIAEAKTLKAFYYLQLWKFWGNVPYYEKNLEFPYIAEQLSANEVYNKVIAMLEEVINSKVLPMKETKTRCGHATQAFAEMLFADYVMYQKDENRYQQALGYMEDIISSTKYSLMSDYASIWEYSGEWCDESIYEINYCAKGSKRGWGNANAPGGTVVPALIGIDGLSYKASAAHLAADPNYSPKQELNGGWGFCDVSKEVYDLYEQNDIRRTGGILNMKDYAADYKARTGDDVIYGGRYQNTGIYNTIGNVLSVDEKYVKALNTAISTSKNFIITKDEPSAKQAISYLKDSHAGRATFFPISVIKERYVDYDTINILKNSNDFVGIMSDLVKYNKEYENIIKSVYENTDRKSLHSI